MDKLLVMFGACTASPAYIHLDNEQAHTGDELERACKEGFVNGWAWAQATAQADNYGPAAECCRALFLWPLKSWISLCSIVVQPLFLCSKMRNFSGFDLGSSGVRSLLRASEISGSSRLPHGFGGLHQRACDALQIVLYPAD